MDGPALVGGSQAGYSTAQIGRARGLVSSCQTLGRRCQKARTLVTVRPSSSWLSPPPSNPPSTFCSANDPVAGSDLKVDADSQEEY